MQENGNDYAIKSVMKAVQMLKLVASNSPATFTELLEQSPFPKATAFRLIHTLEAAGLIECRDGKYVLSSLARIGAECQEPAGIWLDFPWTSGITWGNPQ